jgi:hypothetical protein
MALLAVKIPVNGRVAAVLEVFDTELEAFGNFWVLLSGMAIPKVSLTSAIKPGRRWAKMLGDTRSGLPYQWHRQ